MKNHEVHPGTSTEHRHGENTKRRRAFVIVISWVLLVLYGSGYVWMRLEKHFVRDATYYTDADGTRARTDWIRLGEWRVGIGFEVANSLYYPCRLAESWLWRRLDFSR